MTRLNNQTLQQQQQNVNICSEKLLPVVFITEFFEKFLFSFPDSL